MIGVFSAVALAADDIESQRRELAQKYKNAEPGESFLVGHITFHLSQEYSMMVLQSIKKAVAFEFKNQKGLLRERKRY